MPPTYLRILWDTVQLMDQCILTLEFRRRPGSSDVFLRMKFTWGAMESPLPNSSGLLVLGVSVLWPFALKAKAHLDLAHLGSSWQVDSYSQAWSPNPTTK